MKLDCHHGHQEGLHCLCDSGWISSGIHHDNPIDFHWCDTPEVSELTTQPLAPRKLSKPLEYTAIIVSLLISYCISNNWLIAYVNSKFAINGVMDLFAVQTDLSKL